jgi:MFS superfamily sulfate permease-like transporter
VVHEVEHEVVEIRDHCNTQFLCQIRSNWWWKEISFANLRAGCTVALVSIPLSLSLAVAANASPLSGM